MERSRLDYAPNYLWKTRADPWVHTALNTCSYAALALVCAGTARPRAWATGGGTKGLDVELEVPNDAALRVAMHAQFVSSPKLMPFVLS
jgi:hypothetical protein